MNMLSPVDLERVVEAEAEEIPFGWMPLAAGFIRKRWPSLVLCVVVASALGFFYASQQAPTYSSATTLLVDQRRADNFLPGRAQLDNQGVNAEIESQVEVLRSYGLAEKVVDRLNLADTRDDMPPGSGLLAHRPMPLLSWIGLGKSSAPVADAQTRRAQAADSLLRMTAVRRVGLTFVIEVAVVSESAEGSAKLANGVAQAYVAEQLSGKSQATKEATNWMRARLVELSTQARAADDAVQSYKAANNILATDEGLINDQQLSALTSKLAGFHAAAISAKAQLDQARQMLTSGSAGNVVGEGLQSPIIDNLRQKLLDKQRQYAEWSARFGTQHEAVRLLRGEINDLQAGIRSELQRVVSTATNSLQIAQANEAAAQAQVDASVSQSGRVNKDRVQLRALQSEADTYRTLYASFLQRYSQAAQDQSYPVSEIEVISAAAPPLQKSGPRRGLILGGSAVAGLGIGLFAGLLSEMAAARPKRRGRGRSARGMECLGTLPMLKPPMPRGVSAIGHIRRVMFGGPRPGALRLPRDGSAGLLRLAIDRPNEPFGLAVAAMRREILRRTGSAREGRVIGCLTLNGGEGTSTVAANLAHVLAQGGHRTVLIDLADGENALTRLMRDPGAEPDGFGSRMHQDRATGLMFRPATGPADEVAGLSQLPTGQTMISIVRSLQRKHDFIIIDLPAVERRMPSHDILMQVDDLLMVGRWTPQDEARMMEAPDLAAASAVRCLGIILTMVPPRFCDVV